ncbi:ABC-type bacteriocin/lantibiotic exporter with double-glycine peptidase domain [Mesonia hippocampi]|uniref:ABC-type bacteriocin/lantibiotic exporter with double-glycine peptidase domain n=1 Tax=Mesonia hippocampi TaxID=1628250 RepID=A0A840ES79_9FLAO|nr:ABC transporter six-transmembrane domain-containing protein [Mesonia hippocampi]MBB4119830.1 ABC-type bacteriocin/lantibiotic exporter with double-glycine peptidase domain [Mesonia hippocampi]
MNLKSTIKKYKLSYGFTLFLILLETVIAILFPLFIGNAVEDAINHSYKGAIYLGVLGVLALCIGTGRRIFDSRFYARVYQDLGENILTKQIKLSSSVKTARLGMIEEWVEFMENSMPEIITSVVGIIGVVIVIATLNTTVFIGCLVSIILIACIYWLNSKKTIALNKGYNNELEYQVEVIETNVPFLLKLHLKKMMKWNIKLSDLEALNFSLSWLVLIVFLVLSIIFSVQDGVVQYGALFALVMYVFQYIESVSELPLYYQNWLRLKEIQIRINNIDKD